MEKEDKLPPDEDTGKEATDLETLKKQNEQLAQDKANLEKRLKDKDEMIGKQSNEVGTLREQINEHKVILDRIQGSPPREKDKLTSYLAENLKRQDPELSDEMAEYNAKLLISGYRNLRGIERGAEIEEDGNDRVRESIEDGKIDQKIFNENKDEILQEFSRLKSAKSGYEWYRNIRDSYEIVKKRKADAMRKENKEEAEKERQRQIDEQNLEITKKTQKEQEKEDEKARREIKEAGDSGMKGSVFE